MNKFFLKKTNFLLFFPLLMTCSLHAQTDTIKWDFGTNKDTGMVALPPTITSDQPNSTMLVSVKDNTNQGIDLGTIIRGNNNYAPNVMFIQVTSLTSRSCAASASPTGGNPTGGGSRPCYTNASGGANAEMTVDVYSRTAPQTIMDINSAPYFEITLIPAVDTPLILNLVSFGNRSTTTGPVGYSIRTSLDNYATAIVEDSNAFSKNSPNPNGSWNLIADTLNVSFSAPITIRIYAFAGSGNRPPVSNVGTNWMIDDLTLIVGIAPSIKSLPIKFISFTAIKGKNNTNELSWQTAAEHNVNYFDIGASGDGTNFQSIAQMPAKNISSGASYFYTDKGIISKEYYRITSVDFDGTKNYTSIVSVQNNSAKHIKFQNASVINSLQFISDQQGTMNFIITNAAGQTMIKANVSVAVGNNKINVSNLPKGIYFFKASFNGVAYQFKFLKN